MLTQIGNLLKPAGFCLLCIAIVEKIEPMAVISMAAYGLGTMLVNVGIAKIQSDIEENERRRKND